eukprot:s8481_g2.t1
MPLVFEHPILKQAVKNRLQQLGVPWRVVLSTSLQEGAQMLLAPKISDLKNLVEELHKETLVPLELLALVQMLLAPKISDLKNLVEELHKETLVPLELLALVEMVQVLHSKNLQAVS